MINLFGYAGPDQGAKYLGFSPLVPSKREKNIIVNFIIQKLKVNTLPSKNIKTE